MLTEQREALFNLRLKLRTGHLENTASLGAARREIARLTTVLHEAQLGIDHPSKSALAAQPHAAAAKPKRKPAAKPAHQTKHAHSAKAKPKAGQKTKTGKKSKAAKTRRK